MVRALGIAILVTAAAAGTVRAQGRNGLAVFPYVGVQVATADLLTRPDSRSPVRDREKVRFAGAVGVRASVGLVAGLDLEADVGHASSRLVLSATNSVSGDDVSVTVASGRLVWRLRPPTEPFWASLHAGAGVVRHAFEGPTGASRIGDRTAGAAVVGATAAFRLGSRGALVLGAETYLYSARFDVAPRGGGQAVATTARRQADLRVVAGVRVPLLGR
jgi:hypothetical protein